VVRVLSFLWSAGGVIWVGLCAGVAFAVWAAGAASTVNTRLQALEIHKATTEQRRTEDQRSVAAVLDKIDEANEGFGERLRAVERELAKVAALLERDRRQGAKPTTGDDESVASVPCSEDGR